MSSGAMDQGEHGAHEMDAADPLRASRELFEIPPSPAHTDGRPSIYLCGNSLGLMPLAARTAVVRELDDWGRLGVEGHFKARDGWFAYHELCREPLARLVGALPHEVVAMNSLTVNLHLLMASFFRPRGARRRILIDGPCFPSDVYAVKSQLRLHGIPEADGLVWLRPRPGEETIRTEDALALIEHEGDTIALGLLSGVNYITGQAHDIPAITAALRHRGAVAAWDLAHATGNLDLRLHDWGVDFAAWCSYKFLNSGPGAVAGAFLHERHTRGVDRAAFASMPRLEGWWGNDPGSRFRMGPDFEPVASADAWQLSNPPILALAPLKASLEIFDRWGIAALREKSRRLTAYLEAQVESVMSRSPGRLRIITPREPGRRGCQLSILVERDADGLQKRLLGAGVLCDFRGPNIVRVAPAPLYNTFHDCWRFARVLAEVLE